MNEQDLTPLAAPAGTAPANPEAIAAEGGAQTPHASQPSRRLWAGLSGPTRLLLPIALGMFVIFGMKYASGVLGPIFLAMFLTMGVSPALYWLRRRGVPAWLCVAIVAVATVIVVLLFLLVILSAVNQLDEKLPVYQDHLGTMIGNVQAWFSSHGVDVSSLTKTTLSAGNIIGIAKTVLSSLVGVFGNFFLLILIFIFMVAEAYAIPSKIGRSHMDKKFARSFSNFSDVTRNFLFTKGWLSAIMAIFCTIIYVAFGIDFALLWGMAFFILSFVPNIGFILSVIPPFFVGLLEFGFWRSVIAIIVVVVANTVVDNVISPRIMGRSVGLSTLAVFLSVFIWGWILGATGALMSVPLTLMVKLLFFDSFESTRTISEIMSTPLREMGKRRRKKGKTEVGPAPAVSD
jgi:AI-2 transport protein TqsA